MFSRIFIERPRFAIVISVVMVLSGIISLYKLPVAEYPEIAPPSLYVSAEYTGASAEVVAQTVAMPIEDQINGVEDLLYFSSNSSDNGSYSCNVTFKSGNAIFLAHQLEAAMFHLRDMEGDYAIVPYPMTEKEQGQYYSQVNHWCDCFVAVSSAVDNERIEFVSFMMEAMAAYSNKHLRPFIYETVLKYQRVNDEQSSAMVDVIMDGIVIDYAVVHDIADLAEMVLKAAIDETPLNVQAMVKKNVITSAINEIMKAHGIES